jgi:predicted ATPase/class 3 adenylate cyclase
MPSKPRADSLSPTGTVTFLFTDIEGSTRLWEQDPERMRPALARHDALARTAVEGNRGNVVKMIGDGVHAVFEDPLDAVSATLQLQQALADSEAAGGVPLRVRCGLHLGVVERRDNDFFGSAVNCAARIMAAAHGGQMIVSQAVVDRVADRLPDAVSLRDLGSVRLRDLASPERVYQIVHPLLRQDFPALRSLEATPNNLAQQVNSFVGRERELDDVKKLLANTRLATLLGAGGLGKTRLSLQVAVDLLDNFSDGVWLAELAPLSDPRLLAQAVASVLGVKEGAGRPVQEALLRFVKDRQLLLVLDNCEHLLQPCAELVTQLLQAGPQVKILSTSREPLHVAGETTYQLPSLSVPEPRLRVAYTALTHYEAVRLFVDRAVAAQPEFRLTSRNATTVADICRRLDGIPLAIELAAARVRVLSVETIAARLSDCFRLLTGGDRTALPRQRTLRACIDWSYELLAEPERALLRRLAVFAGGWTLEAAEAVGADRDVEATEVLDLLTQLVEKSLAAMEVEGKRYRLLETVRQYARERLLESGGGEAVRERHRDYFLALTEEAEPKLTGAEQAAWLQRLEEEHENLRASLDFSLGEAGSEKGLRLCGALQRFWMTHVHFSEGRDWSARFLGQAGAEERTLERAKVLNGAGLLAHYQSDQTAAAALLEECLAIQRQWGDRRGIAWSLTNLGLVAYEQGDFASARALHEESLAIMRELGNQSGIGAALNNLAGVAHQQGDFAYARALLEQCLAIKRELGERGRIANSLGNLGNVALDQGDFASARALCEECLAIMRELGNRGYIATTLDALGRVAYFQGDYPTARMLSEESLAIMRELQHRNGMADSLYSLGNVTYEQGDYQAARKMFAEGLVIRRERDDRRGMVSSLAGLAAVIVALGSSLHAARIWGAAERLREQIGAPLPPNERPRYDQRVAGARAASKDDIAFDSAWQEGRALTLEVALELALAETVKRP